MIVTVRLFAVARQRAGAAEIGVELPSPSTVSALKRAVADQHPALAPLLPGMMVAVDNEYVEDDRPVEQGQEVALIPPVSGGVDLGSSRQVSAGHHPLRRQLR